MLIGDLVVRKSYGKDITFKIIDEYEDHGGSVLFILKGVNLRIEADSLESDLEIVTGENSSKADIIFNKRINDSIQRVLAQRDPSQETEEVFKNNLSKDKNKKYKGKKYGNKNIINKSEESRSENFLGYTRGKYYEEDDLVLDKALIFGRPGRILHIDGDPDYLQVCLKTYKGLLIDAVGVAIAENEQSDRVLELVREIKPDIIVLTGHDGMFKKTGDEVLNLDNYRNSKYFVDTVRKLRIYEPSYDELVIFAGACQSCYEALLDAGANFASSPNRVLIHCLDPVLVCEKVAYTNIEKFVAIGDVIKNTITGIKGIGGMQTRGKYREGFPKSVYLK